MKPSAILPIGFLENNKIECSVRFHNFHFHDNTVSQGALLIRRKKVEKKKTRVSSLEKELVFPLRIFKIFHASLFLYFCIKSIFKIFWYNFLLLLLFCHFGTLGLFAYFESEEGEINLILYILTETRSLKTSKKTNPNSTHRYLQGGSFL